MHTAAYRSFRDVGFVIHTHQKYATALGLTGDASLDMTEEEREKLGGIGTAAYGLSGTKKLSLAITEVFERGCETVLMVQPRSADMRTDGEGGHGQSHAAGGYMQAQRKGHGCGGRSRHSGHTGGFTDELRAAFAEADVFRTEAVDICAAAGMDIPAQIDDMAQIDRKEDTGCEKQR